MAKPTETQQPDLNKQLAEATKNRDTFVAQANQQIAFLNGKIAMLEELMNPPEAEEVAKSEAAGA